MLWCNDIILEAGRAAQSCAFTVSPLDKSASANRRKLPLHASAGAVDKGVAAVADLYVVVNGEVSAFVGLGGFGQPLVNAWPKDRVMLTITAVHFACATVDETLQLRVFNGARCAAATVLLSCGVKVISRTPPVSRGP